MVVPSGVTVYTVDPIAYNATYEMCGQRRATGVNAVRNVKINILPCGKDPGSTMSECGMVKFWMLPTGRRVRIEYAHGVCGVPRITPVNENENENDNNNNSP